MNAYRRCRYCNEQTRHYQQPQPQPTGCAEILGHAALTVLTLGIWFPIGCALVFYKSYKASKPARWACEQCGQQV